MPSFGSKSKAHLDQCHPSLQKVLKLAIKTVDFSIICSYRGKRDQEAAYEAGNTKVHYPNSAHNYKPSVAIDFIPYPFTYWGDKKAFLKVARAITLSGKQLGIGIRSGTDFNMDGDKTTSDAWDWGHIELNPWRDWVKK